MNRQETCASNKTNIRAKSTESGRGSAKKQNRQRKINAKSAAQNRQRKIGNAKDETEKSKLELLVARIVLRAFHKVSPPLHLCPFEVGHFHQMRRGDAVLPRVSV